MKFSEKWLREWVSPDLSSQELMDQITMAGLEVDGFEPVAGSFEGVVVGQIVSAEQHPNADKLRVCQVTDGVDQFQVVCGAANARAGIKVAFAKVGAVLPGNFKIKKAKLRQVESLGMLCSEKELELSDNHDGIMELSESLELGESLKQALGLNDISIEVDLTPNRADCLSIAGLAREVGALNNVKVMVPSIGQVEPEIDDEFPIVVEDWEGCPRYLGRVVRGVNISAETPLWMQERLRRSGVRTIDPVVDVTNYVMLELGQPLHGFDLDVLRDKIIVRQSKAGEEIVLLDGSKVELSDGTLLIADASGPLAIAGIMGGAHSGVTATTQNVFLEAAFFDPIRIAGKARSYGLHTDASHRFERGVDYKLSFQAMERATELLISICGGQAGPVSVIENIDSLPKKELITLPLVKVEQVLGIQLPDDNVEQILVGLGLEVIKKEGRVLTLKAPSFRFDITITEDLIEEIARVHGYNNIPVTYPVSGLEMPALKEADISHRVIKNSLVSLGMQEIVTYSFLDRKTQSLFESELEPVALANPISEDLAVMRTSLIPNLVKTLSYNINRQQERIRLFETGLSFINTNDGLLQNQKLAGLIYGDRYPKNWLATEEVDFYDLKSIVETVLALAPGKQCVFEPGQIEFLHPGQTAFIRCDDDQIIGYLGLVHPSIRKTLGLKKGVFVFELDMSFFNSTRIPEFSELSRYPETSRDIAVIVSDDLPVGELLKAVDEAAGDYLKDKFVFDVYKGKGIDLHRKSVALGLTWQHPSRTLNDEEINGWMNAVIDILSKRFEAKLRG
ncbi:phenylalanine--tRNA ligase subunit beta [Gynuella sunshinyii]|uniref:Phenylalanine--tRNA ligase beta subunit n=1 Tax=Gynuella sunshinyii YC6258 TaxID=1445510 RepID=A0A0C5VP95_9GAMM|nr:phenylalanine--tRNA ligase subunit beta [Gynuella sunshinyii]AJQ95208.1 phenylalanyl-tRNA synthetase beta subunit [Gynuella sunshinyii YC6258]